MILKKKNNSNSNFVSLNRRWTYQFFSVISSMTLQNKFKPDDNTHCYRVANHRCLLTGYEHESVYET